MLITFVHLDRWVFEHDAQTLTEASYGAAEGVILLAHDQFDHVGGATNLYDRGILRHRVTWVREMTRHELEKSGDGEVTIEHIRLASCRPDEEPKEAAWLAGFRFTQ